MNEEKVKFYNIEKHIDNIRRDDIIHHIADSLNGIVIEIKLLKQRVSEIEEKLN